MKMFGRRSAISKAPAAAIGAAVFANSTNKCGGNASAPPIGKPGCSQRAACGAETMPTQDPEYIKRNLFSKALREQTSPIRYRTRIRDQYAESRTVPPNIAALRSVSDQHKIHMTLNWNDSMVKEEQSWTARIAESVGLTLDKVRGMLY